MARRYEFHFRVAKQYSFRKLQILISQTTDFHFVLFRFVSLHFVSQTTVSRKITDLISQLEDLKLDFGASARDVRQWKKDKKNEFSPFVQERDKISELLLTKQKQRDEEIEKQNWEAKREREECVKLERQQQEKEFWEEKFRAELRVAEQKLEMETAAKEK